MKTIQYAVNLVILCLPVWLSLASVPAVGGITVRSSRQIGKDNFTFIPSMTLQLQERHQNQPNNITLSCRNATLDLTSADFWLLQNTAGSIPQDLTTINITYMYSTDKAVISFTLRPEIEGYFFCGNIAAMEKSSNNLTLLGMYIFYCMYSSPSAPSVYAVCVHLPALFMQPTLHPMKTM